jgi:F420-dependent oxidoreductase-like protein
MMRFGLLCPPQNRSWDELLEFHRIADDIPVYESIWGSDHFFPAGADATAQPLQLDGRQFEGWTITAAMAQATKRLRLGPLVTCVAYRNPGLLANIVATVDVISGGRVEMALGCGWNDAEGRAYGMPLGTMTQRMDRFAEYLDVLVRLFDQPCTTFTGRFYSLEKAGLSLAPVQRPHPPIVIGGVGPKRTIPLVARYARHWNLALTPPEGVGPLLDLLQWHCAAGGRDPAEIEKSVMIRLAGPDAIEALVDQAAAYDGTGIELAIISLSSPTVHPDILEPLARALVDGGLAASAR